MQWITEETTIVMPKRDPNSNSPVLVQVNLVELVSYIRQLSQVSDTEPMDCEVPDDVSADKPVLVLDLDLTLILASKQLINDKKPDLIHQATAT
jgi:hypothetical protein